MTGTIGPGRRTGTAELPLHGGRAPLWLARRMARLARAIGVHIIQEGGPEEFLRRLSDPFWFQAFGCVLGFDWHSSGVTTTVCGALKEGLAPARGELGLAVCGGKGARGRRTPDEIDSFASQLALASAPLAYASRMAAKVDSSAVQSGHAIYHHSFFFARSGAWAVVQQGMNAEAGTARRYHWLGEGVRCFVEEPHAAVCADSREEVLNMVAREAAGARKRSAELARLDPGGWVAEAASRLRALGSERRLVMPERHWISPEDFSSARLRRVLEVARERSPAGFEELLGLPGVGAKTVRALALASELIYGEPVSFRDPARFSFAHGGKDGHPFPVDRAAYDRTIAFLGETVNKARLAWTEKRDALRRLAALSRPG